jgi:hypothetical protein
MEDQVIRAVLVLAALIGALYLVWKYTPAFVKRHVWTPITNVLWHTPRQRKGWLWAVWFLYCVGVSMATLTLFAADRLTGEQVFNVFLLSIPAVVGKKLLDARSKRKKRRYQLPARRGSSGHRPSRRYRLPGRP